MPTIIRGVYYEGWTLHRDLGQLRDREAMISRVKAELAPDLRLDPADVLRAVIHLLVEHVSKGQIQHVLATLPKSIAALWHELTGRSLELSPPPRGQAATAPRRSGYTRSP